MRVDGSVGEGGWVCGVRVVGSVGESGRGWTGLWARVDGSVGEGGWVCGRGWTGL